MKRKIFFVVAVFLSGCALDPQRITGTWKAAAFFENGKTVDANLSSVTLKLNADGDYEFTSNGNYQEKGRYESSGNYLFLTDTTRNPAVSYTVRVLFVSKDSLKIKMRSNAAEQVLFLAKAPQ